LYRRLADGGTADELLFESPEGKTPTSFSPDGKLLLFTRYKARGQDADIWALPLDRHRDPFPVVETPFHEGSAVYSPDGRWIAYVSNDSGDRQVYVQPFAGPEPRIRLSTTSGTWPVWTRGGREIVYATIEQELMAVDITIDGQTIQASAPHKLFAQPYIGSYWNSFAVDASGERFLIAVPEEESSRTLTVVLNWPALLGAK
jgi:Tol biopolymer transport system component